MSVTPTHNLPGGLRQGERKRSKRDSDDELRSERQGQDTPDHDSDSESGSNSKLKRIGGGLGIFVILALYFLWIGNEMGGHSVSGGSEMVAIFSAIFLGLIALLAGGAMGRRRDN